MRYRRVLAAIGGIVRIFSYSALVPLVASLVWDERVAPIGPRILGLQAHETTVAFGLFFALVFLLGMLLRVYGVREIDELREREGFVIVGFSWFLLAILAAVPYIVLRAADTPLDAVFEAMSGITTTGATVLSAPFDQYPESLMIWRATNQYIGGIGIVVLSIAVIGRLAQGGHKLVAMEAPGGTAARLRPKITQTAKALGLVYVTLSVILFPVYLVLMWRLPQVGGFKQAAYDALYHTMTTMSTGGFSNRSNSFAFYDDPAIRAVATIFMVIAGGSFTLYWALSHGRPGVLFRSADARFYVSIFGVASLVLAGSLWWQGRTAGQALSHGAFQAATFLTGTGYTSMDHNGFHDAARLLLLLLMFTGGMAGSTSGGIKTFRIHILLKLTRREMQRLLHPHAVLTVKSEGRILPDMFIRRVVVFFFAYITLFILGAFVYIASGLDLLSGIAASAASLGNVGPGLGSVASSFGAVPAAGKMMAILQMWFGRLEIFTVLLLFVPATYKD